MNHFSLDIETLGVSPYSVILSIGMCAFDHNGVDSRDFYVTLDVDQQINIGMSIDPVTVRWWMEQSQEAREVFTQQKEVTINHAYDMLHDFVNIHQPDEKSRYLWGNGVSFDNVLLDCLFSSFDLPLLFNFRNYRDVRTVADLAKIDSISCGGKEDIKHHALYDARSQARTVVSSLKKLKIIL